MKVELISLMLAASLAVVAALPVETSGGGVTAEGAREERARKETAKLRLMEAIANSRSSPPSAKEKQSTIAHPVKEESKVTVSKSESTTTSKATAPKSEEMAAKIERQRSIADQALRERLRQTGRAKEQLAPGAAAHSASEAAKTDSGKPQLEAVDVPPVVYVPMSSQTGSAPLRFAPYVPAMRPHNAVATYSGSTRRLRWPFANFFPVIINDPFLTLTGGYGYADLIEYGPSADVCHPSRDSTRLNPEETEVAMEAGSYKMIVRGGGVAIAGPGGIATAGRGGTAIVGPGGVVYTSPGGLAVVGPGGKVLARKKGAEVKAGGAVENPDGEVILARGPVVYYDSSEDEK